ncbi:MAG: hypothetical protein GYB65_12360 [Chloroflexi bacterium]|nr:hypothetical protein [Chloroflexota bacterium]
MKRTITLLFIAVLFATGLLPTFAQGPGEGDGGAPQFCAGDADGVTFIPRDCQWDDGDQYTGWTSVTHMTDQEPTDVYASGTEVCSPYDDCCITIICPYSDNPFVPITRDNAGQVGLIGTYQRSHNTYVVQTAGNKLMISNSETAWIYTFGSQGQLISEHVTSMEYNSIYQKPVNPAELNALLQQDPVIITPPGGIVDAQLDPAGGLLVTTSQDGAVEGWDPDSGASLYSLAGHVGGAVWIAFSPDGSLVATAGLSEQGLAGADEIRIWDAANGNPVALLEGEPGITSMAFNPAGTLFAAGGESEIVVWDVDAANPAVLLEYNPDITNDLVNDVAFSPDGTQLAAGGSVYAQVYDTATWQPQYVLDEIGYVAEVAFSIDGSVLFTGGDQLVLSDSSDGTLLNLLGTLPENGILLDLDLTPDGALLSTLTAQVTESGDLDNFEIALWGVLPEPGEMTTSAPEEAPATEVPANSCIAVPTQDAPVYAGPGEDFDVLGALEAEEMVIVLGVDESGFWYRVDFAGGGWASGPALASILCSGPTALPVMDADGMVIAVPEDDTDADDVADETGDAAGDVVTFVNCTITTNSNVNLRGGPGTEYDIVGTLAAGQVETIDWQATGTDGFVWWHLITGSWARSDVVIESGDCDSVPAIAQ